MRIKKKFSSLHQDFDAKEQNNIKNMISYSNTNHIKSKDIIFQIQISSQFKFCGLLRGATTNLLFSDKFLDRYF